MGSAARSCCRLPSLEARDPLVLEFRTRIAFRRVMRHAMPPVPVPLSLAPVRSQSGWPLPGLAWLACSFALAVSGISRLAATWALFFTDPATT
jgi:hypothetical protein